MAEILRRLLALRLQALRTMMLGLQLVLQLQIFERWMEGDTLPAARDFSGELADWLANGGPW
jgi:hypothetical protein